MSLSAWEQRALDAIKGRLSASDPKLVALLATFSRLVAGEAMPVREKLRAGSRWAARHSIRRRRSRWNRGIKGSPGMIQSRVFGQIALLLWLVIAVTMVATGLTLSRGGTQGECTVSFAAACASPPAAHSAQSRGA